ncbi:electron transfer flavoprotein subunit beta/FixA family protein [Halanaeroarchaeum sulfurireducens]|uniref:Electron transfer flavoprotein subunit beta n=1 Tax=Halanaeroarchaeum sulfurireducens TaxID=1604004 RepID=A0A0N9MY76_9EURY|nr:electron transfer flavoprotein subunit beta/FixA family protein [Halanaeroarchaeum sulfurireducens]ALG82949.1 electron transfer flavoprotein subunit beta [Halanaeroarchaeum sulfurireducens]
MTQQWNIVVCVKQVPDADDVSIDPETGTLNRSDAAAVLNQPDYNAIEAALQLREEVGGTVSAVTMGPPFAVDVLETAVALGADDGMLLTDRAFGGSDTWPTSLALAKISEELDADVVVCGEESTDCSTGQVPPGVAAHNDWAQLTYVEELEPKPEDDELVAKRDIEGGHEMIAAELPVVVAMVFGTNSPRVAGLHRKIFAETDFEAEEYSASDLGIEEKVGLANSPTSVGGMDTADPVPREKEVFDDVDSLFEAFEEEVV